MLATGAIILIVVMLAITIILPIQGVAKRRQMRKIIHRETAHPLPSKGKMQIRKIIPLKSPETGRRGDLNTIVSNLSTFRVKGGKF